MSFTTLILAAALAVVSSPSLAKDIGERIDVAGVTVFLVSSDCASAESRPLVVDLGRRRSLDLTDILERVASHARKKGIEAVSGIQVDVRGSARKTHLFATATPCAYQKYAQVETLPIDPRLASIARDATRVRVYRIAGQNWQTVDLNQLTPASQITDPAQLAEIKNVVLAPTTYDPPPKFQKACGFFSESAISFDTADGRRLWMQIAAYCLNVRFVEQGGDWRTTTKLNVTYDALARLLATVGLPPPSKPPA